MRNVFIKKLAGKTQFTLSLVEQTSEQMQGYYDARSEAWQDSERGQAFTEAMESVADAAEALREIP